MHRGASKAPLFLRGRQGGDHAFAGAGRIKRRFLLLDPAKGPRQRSRDATWHQSSGSGSIRTPRAAASASDPQAKSGSFRRPAWRRSAVIHCRNERADAEGAHIAAIEPEVEDRVGGERSQRDDKDDYPPRQSAGLNVERLLLPCREDSGGEQAASTAPKCSRACRGTVPERGHTGSRTADGRDERRLPVPVSDWKRQIAMCLSSHRDYAASGRRCHQCSVTFRPISGGQDPWSNRLALGLAQQVVVDDGHLYGKR